VALGLVLLVVGVVVLASIMRLVTLSVLWPTLLIVIGLLFLARSVAKRS
jgi:hypothetical protein